MKQMKQQVKIYMVLKTHFRKLILPSLTVLVIKTEDADDSYEKKTTYIDNVLRVKQCLK